MEDERWIKDFLVSATKEEIIIVINFIKKNNFDNGIIRVFEIKLGEY